MCFPAFCDERELSLLLGRGHRVRKPRISLRAEDLNARHPKLWTVLLCAVMVILLVYVPHGSIGVVVLLVLLIPVPVGTWLERRRVGSS